MVPLFWGHHKNTFLPFDSDFGTGSWYALCTWLLLLSLLPKPHVLSFQCLRVTKKKKTKKQVEKNGTFLSLPKNISRSNESGYRIYLLKSSTHSQV